MLLAGDGCTVLDAWTWAPTEYGVRLWWMGGGVVEANGDAVEVAYPHLPSAMLVASQVLAYALEGHLLVVAQSPDVPTGEAAGVAMGLLADGAVAIWRPSEVQWRGVEALGPPGCEDAGRLARWGWIEWVTRGDVSAGAIGRPRRAADA